MFLRKSVMCDGANWLNRINIISCFEVQITGNYKTEPKRVTSDKNIVKFSLQSQEVEKLSLSQNVKLP